VKKNDQELTLLNTDIVSDKDLEKNNYKTTNINILLNRVRLDKKRTLKKRIIISFFLGCHNNNFDCLFYYLAKLHLKSILKQ
jgi:hypothetical protein